MTPEEIVAFIHARRLPLTSEKATQVALADEFRKAAIMVEREVRLDEFGIIDFLAGDIGIEIKLRGQRRAIYHQCAFYCEHDRVRSLVLATNAAMGMPITINGKPVFVAHLGRAWL